MGDGDRPAAAGEGLSPIFDEAREHADRRAPYTMRLGTPIDHLGRRIESLTFKPLRGRSLRLIPADRSTLKLDAFLRIASQCTGEPDGVFDHLDIADGNACIEVVSAFLEASRKTGASA